MDGERVRGRHGVPGASGRVDLVAGAATRSRRRGPRPRLRRRRPGRGAPRARPALPGGRLDAGDGGCRPRAARPVGHGRPGRPQPLRPARACSRHDGLPRDLLRARSPRVLRACTRVHDDEARLRPQSAAVPRRRRARRPARRRVHVDRVAAVLRSPDRLAAPPGARRREGARAKRPVRAARAPRAFHVSRRQRRVNRKADGTRPVRSRPRGGGCRCCRSGRSRAG